MRARAGPSRLVTTASALLAALILAGCAGRGAPRSAGMPVVVSLYPLGEFARRVGGARVAVRTLVPPGVEPHDYEPTPRDMTAVERARVFIYNGAGFERWVERLLPELPAAVRRVSATEGMALLTPDWSSAGVDPHVWLDPLRAQEQVERIAAGLSAADPPGRPVYRANAAALRADLAALHARYEQVLRGCRRKEFVTTHAAFGYLADRYRLRQVPITGLDPESEPSPARLRLIVAFLRRSRTPVVYTETLVSPRVAEALAREAGARVRVLNPIEGLTPDEQARGATYFTVMDANLTALADGLDCGR